MGESARTSLVPPGGWVALAMIYLYGVSASASLSKVIPILGDIGTHLGVPAAGLALLISLMTILPAVLASMAGAIIDRLGAHRALQLVAATGAAVNAAYLAAPGLGTFMAIRVAEGLVAVGAYSAAPALIMATTAPQRIGRAMAVWSTYSAVGVSLGLVMSGSFAGTAHWRGGYGLHLALFGLLLATSWLLPRAPATPRRGARPARLLETWTQPGPLRLSLAFATLVVMGFGMNTVYPQWFARLHAVPVGQASNILALATLVMIAGGLLGGALLARGRRDGRLLAALMLAAVVASVPVFVPGPGQGLRIAAMVAWMLVQGAAIAVVTAALPRVVRNPLQGAAAAGLLSQLAALVTFVTPLLWQPSLRSGNWLGFILVVAAAAAAAWALFPRRAGP